MKLNLPLLGLVIFVVALVAVAVIRPSWISDSNSFLDGFVNYPILTILGVILSITLGSLFQMHLNLTRMEEQQDSGYFAETRKEIKNSACCLIGLFAASFVVVLAKPLSCVTESETAAANAAAIFIFVFFMLILLDITLAIFRIRPGTRVDKNIDLNHGKEK